MKTTIRTTAAALGIAALLGAGIATGHAFAATPTPGASATSTEVARALTFSREEERMARDLYAALALKYDGARPFSMITRSEDHHFDAVGRLLERYHVTDPSADRAAGRYADPTIQALYNGWLAQGSASLQAAYTVGVALEQRDIADLGKGIAAALPTDIDTVFGQLLRGSQNHLAAYQRAVAGDLGTGAGMGGRWSSGGATSGRGTATMGDRSGHGGPSGTGSGMRGGNGMGGDCPYAGADD